MLKREMAELAGCERVIARAVGRFGRLLAVFVRRCGR